MIETQTLKFLKDIESHNNREWFEKHKSDYTLAQENIKALMVELEDGLNRSDSIESKKIFRIYRDVRFSKDKTPYKNYFSGYFKRLGAERRGSYYFSIQPNNTVIGGGFYGPNKEDLFRIRKEFEADGETIKGIVNDANFIKTFGTLQGNGVATAPKGFDKTHPNIHFIRKKQFYAFRQFTDKEVLSKDFPKIAIETFIAIRPFFDYMSDVLTTNLNGESILK
ncbi:MAG: DUF2461 domain-containing protein [Bacteroidia bacterium]|nr:DUF2461 domain-containing protein [Bacteroidia bacterium]NNJ56810.1 DUF2461 domain-containing protein [Bacteroidia bacterium]